MLAAEGWRQAMHSTSMGCVQRLTRLQMDGRQWGQVGKTVATMVSAVDNKSKWPRHLGGGGGRLCL